MLKKILKSAGAIIMSLFIFGACSNVGTKIPFTVNPEHNGMGGELTIANVKELVRTFDDLKTILEEQLPVSNDNKEQVEKFITNILTTYNSDYFESKALILYLQHAGGYISEERRTVDYVSVKENTLIVDIKSNLSNGIHAANDVPVFWRFIIEVNQSDVANVTTLQII